jgi:NADPH2:quinone reductase
MSQAVRVHTHGGPDVLKLEDVDPGVPGPGEVLLRHTAIGLNFIDIYERTGLYKVDLPAILGREGAGIVEAIGPDVRTVAVGDRVAYVAPNSGAYCQRRVIAAARVVRLPADVSDQQAAALMLKGLTVQALLRQTYRVRRNDFVLIHAAAGGVGLLAVQWARHLGATVIGVVGSPEKAELARRHGADHVFLLTDDWVTNARQIARGQGVHAVYDSVGKDTFMQSLDCLRPRGIMVTFGNASGPVEPFAPLELSKRGSLYLTRPTLFHYIATRSALSKAAQEMLDLVARGVLSVHIGQTYALRDVARAHQDLENRRTTGSTVLVP